MNRRQLLERLLCGAAAALCPRAAWGIGERSKLRLAQLLYTGGNPRPRPLALQRLAWEVDKRTSIDVSIEPLELTLQSHELFRYPMLYLGGDQGFAPFSPSEIATLQRFLVFGGFLLIDSAAATTAGPFDQSVRALCQDLFPKHPFKHLSREHSAYKSFYLLEQVVGRVAAVPYLEGITKDDRTVLIYCQNDLGGAWARDNFGQWQYGVYPGGDRQREQAIRWGVNLVMYALCVDYKADQVHVPFILKRRRWQVP